MKNLDKPSPYLKLSSTRTIKNILKQVLIIKTDNVVVSEPQNIFENKPFEIYVIWKIGEQKYKKMIKFVYQNSPKGTGDAVLKCEKFIKSDFFLMLMPDDLIIKNKEEGLDAEYCALVGNTDRALKNAPFVLEDSEDYKKDLNYLKIKSFSKERENFCQHKLGNQIYKLKKVVL